MPSKANSKVAAADNQDGCQKSQQQDGRQVKEILDGVESQQDGSSRQVKLGMAGKANSKVAATARDRAQGS